MQQRVGDASQLLQLRGRECVDDVVAHGGDVAGRGRHDLGQPGGVSRAFVARPSSGQGKRSTRPRSSRRRTTWESRGKVAFVRWASVVIRRVRSVASESIASTKYSKWVSPASRRSWESSTPGSSSTTATSLTHVPQLLLVQPLRVHGQSLPSIT